MNNKCVITIMDCWKWELPVYQSRDGWVIQKGSQNICPSKLHYCDQVIFGLSCPPWTKILSTTPFKNNNPFSVCPKQCVELHLHPSPSQGSHPWKETAFFFLEKALTLLDFPNCSLLLWALSAPVGVSPASLISLDCQMVFTTMLAIAGWVLISGLSVDFLLLHHREYLPPPSQLTLQGRLGSPIWSQWPHNSCHGAHDHMTSPFPLWLLLPTFHDVSSLHRQEL